MGSKTFAADEYGDIAARMKALEAEKAPPADFSSWWSEKDVFEKVYVGIDTAQPGCDLSAVYMYGVTDEDGGADKAWEEMIDKLCASSPGTLYAPIGETVGSHAAKCKVFGEVYGIGTRKLIDRNIYMPWTTATMKEDCQDELAPDIESIEKQANGVLVGVMAFLKGGPTKPDIFALMSDIDCLADWLVQFASLPAEKSNG